MPAPLVLLAKAARARAIRKAAGSIPGGIPGLVAMVLLCVLVFAASLLTAVAGMFASAGSGFNSMGGALCGQGGGPSNPSAIKGISQVALDAYTKASEATGVKWSLIAAIGKIESGHGTYGGSHLTTAGNAVPPILGHVLDGSGVGGNTTPMYYHGQGADPSGYDRAVGPTQFLLSTWYGGAGKDGNGDGVKDPQNIYDAALATASKLRADGALDNERAAIFSYNHLNSYVDQVLQYEHDYDAMDAANPGAVSTASDATTTPAAAAPTRRKGKTTRTHKGTTAKSGKTTPAGKSTATSTATSSTTTASGSAAADSSCDGGLAAGINPGGKVGDVLAFVNAQLGKPYVFGATGPDAYDCSGLIYAAYASIGVTIPRTSQAQWAGLPHVPAGQEQPGDLVFFPGDDGTREAPGHVGIVTDPKEHLMINAPMTGIPVEVAVYSTWTGGVVGFARPVIPADKPTAPPTGHKKN